MMRFNPFDMFSPRSESEEITLNQLAEQRIEARLAMAQQAAPQGVALGQSLGSGVGGAFVGVGGAFVGVAGAPAGRPVLFSGPETVPGPFASWIRGLEMETEIHRFDFLICHKRNAPDKLEFRRKVGILNWMEVVKDYKE